MYPPTGNGDIGTSYENTDLNLPVNSGYKLLVDYTLSATANAGAGAVRMFVLRHRRRGHPQCSHRASLVGRRRPGVRRSPRKSLSGTLSLDFTTAATIRTFGLTYDASNDTEGTVTFTNLRLEYFTTGTDIKVTVPVSFCVPEEPEEEMPPTGNHVTSILMVAAGLLVVGTVAVVFATRRRRA